MLFTPENAKKIMDGLKTQTRRPVKKDEFFRKNLYSQIIGILIIHSDLSRVLKWEVGKIYAVQPGRGKMAIGYIKLLSIWQERLQDISEDDAKAEGVSPIYSPGVGLLYKPSYRNLWDDIYARQSGLSWEDNPDVWVLEFELTEGRW